MIYLGLLINPKTKQPVHAMYDGGYVKIYTWLPEPGSRRPKLQKVGAGYYDDEFEGCPRTHTPNGVTVKGMGLGTVLYSALALGTTYRQDVGLDQACVHSVSGDRSREAERWWAAAVDMDLAEDTEIEALVDFEDEDWSDYLDTYSLEQWGGEDVHEITNWSFTVSGVRGGEKEGQFLRLETIAEHGILALLPDNTRGNATVVTSEAAFLKKGYVEIDDYRDDPYGNIEWPTDEEEAAPLLAMDTKSIPRDFRNYLRGILQDHAGISEEQLVASGYAVPTDPERYGGRQLEMEVNPSDEIPEVRQVRRIWRSLAKLPG